jgi:hypothetical protein
MVSRLSIILCVFLVTGCTTIQSDAWVKPILISNQDVLTEQTAKDILVHNETWEENK